MKKLLALVVVATIGLSSSAFAAPPPHASVKKPAHSTAHTKSAKPATSVTPAKDIKVNKTAASKVPVQGQITRS